MPEEGNDKLLDDVMVSIFMLTYNQKNYIAQAIEGVLMQKTAFNIELVIGDDGSTDGTLKICEDYKNKHPEKIRLLSSKENRGLIKNYVRTYKECKGKYVAICDGDDYWYDALKLQNQVEILETRPEISVVFSNLKELYPSGKLIKAKPAAVPQITSFENIILGNYIHSVTVMFRNKPLKPEIEEWILQFPYGDWQTYLWVLNEGGKIFRQEEVTAVYRKNIGVSSGIMKQKAALGEVNLRILQKMKMGKNFDLRKNQINKSIFEHKERVMGSYNKDKKFWKAFRVMLELLIKKNDLSIFRQYCYSLKRTFFSA